MKNKYIKETKKKIAKYDKMKDLIELRNKDIEILKRQQPDADELTQEGIRRAIRKIENEIAELMKEMEALTRGFKYLDANAHKIIEFKYKKNETWVAISLHTGYCQRQCQRIANDALFVIAECLYGIEVHEDLPLIKLCF